MCAGMFTPPRPPTPQRMDPAPPLKPPPPPVEQPTPENLTEKDKDKDKLRDKRKELEIEKVKQGVKEFDAIKGDQVPDTPPGGVNAP